MNLITLLFIAVMLDVLDAMPEPQTVPDEWSALDALCFAADRDDTDDPRMWTGVR